MKNSAFERRQLRLKKNEEIRLANAKRLEELAKRPREFMTGYVLGPHGPIPLR